MAYQLNLADNRLSIFDQSRLPITDSLSVLNFADNRDFKKCRYISLTDILVNRYAIPAVNTQEAILVEEVEDSPDRSSPIIVLLNTGF